MPGGAARRTIWSDQRDRRVFAKRTLSDQAVRRLQAQGFAYLVAILDPYCTAVQRLCCTAVRFR